jgi:Flavodoxin domain
MTMGALVVYESVYGDSRQIAEAIADGLGGALAEHVAEIGDRLGDVDLLVVGGPTHMHGLPTSLSRKMAVQAATEDDHAAVEPHASEDPGLRRWLRDLPRSDGARAAAFDTRIDRSPAVAGSAARAIARRLRRRGCEVVATESFLVADAEGPIEDGELERARAWGAALAQGVGAGSAGVSA